MTYHYYHTLISEYLKVRDKEQFLGEIGYPADLDLEPDQLVKAIDIIAAVADKDISQLVKISAMSMMSFSKAYNIPYRSLQNWVSGERTAPDYVTQMLGYALIGDMS